MSALIGCAATGWAPGRVGRTAAAAAALPQVASELAGLDRDSRYIAYVKASNTGAYERFGESSANSAPIQLHSALMSHIEAMGD